MFDALRHRLQEAISNLTGVGMATPNAQPIPRTRQVNNLPAQLPAYDGSPLMLGTADKPVANPKPTPRTFTPLGQIEGNKYPSYNIYHLPNGTEQMEDDNDETHVPQQFTRPGLRADQPVLPANPYHSATMYPQLRQSLERKIKPGIL